MLRFVAISALAACASASGTYSLGAPALVNYAAAPVAFAAAPVALAAAPQHYVVNAAVHSNHLVKHYDVPSSGAISATTIDVPANVLPLNFIFRSASSAVDVKQVHQGAQGSLKETASQDEPHVLKHSVTKPIIQEVREIISPFRRVTQTVEPVREEIQTLVAKGVGATQGQLLAANMAAAPLAMAAPIAMAARPALMAAPMTMAAPMAMTAPLAMAAPAFATSYAAAPMAYAAPALTTSYAAPAMALNHGNYGAGLALNTGFYAAKKL